jgi:hypothetical protein
VILKSRDNLVDEVSVFDDPEALITLAQRSFERAASAEVVANDSLAIPTHGAIDGELVVRPPPGAKMTHKH